jgi:hypothetical protein
MGTLLIIVALAKAWGYSLTLVAFPPTIEYPRCDVFVNDAVIYVCPTSEKTVMIMLAELNRP